MKDEQLQQLSDNFVRFKRAMQAYIRDATADWGLSPAEFEVLRSIYALQPVSSKDLATHMQLTPGAISQLLEGLLQSGSVVQTPSKQDRRIKFLSVSDDGAQRLLQLKEFRAKFLSEALTDVAPSDIQIYLQVQNTLIEWLESQGETCETN